MIRVSPIEWDETTQTPHPSITITVEGFHDVYRLASHLTMGQSEFAEIGFRLIRGLRAKFPKAKFAYQMKAMHDIRPVQDAIDWNDTFGSIGHRRRRADRLEEIADEFGLKSEDRVALFAAAAELHAVASFTA